MTDLPVQVDGEPWVQPAGQVVVLRSALKVSNCFCDYILNSAWMLRSQLVWIFYPLFSENPLMSTFVNSEDPDEMQHNAAFHQGLHCKGKKDLQAKESNFFLKIIHP